MGCGQRRARGERLCRRRDAAGVVEAAPLSPGWETKGVYELGFLAALPQSSGLRMDRRDPRG